MALSWFIKTKSGQYGPLTARKLKALADAGRITARTFVRREDQDKWSRAERFREFKAPDEPVPEQPFIDNEASVPIIITDPPAQIPEAPSRRSSSKLAIIIGAITVVCAIGVAALFLTDRKSSDTTNAVAELFSNKLTTEELVAQSEPSIAFIKGRLSTGTGFLIAKGILATNRHVIDSELMRHIEVHFPSAPENKRGPFTASVLYLDDNIDLALLKVDASLEPLTCAKEYTFRRGQEIVVIGNPGVTNDVVLKNAVSRGVMSTQTIIDGRQYNQLGVSINAGNSGGPVFDDSGSVIGVVTLKAVEKEGLGFSIPIQSVNKSLAVSNKMTTDEIAKTQSMHRAHVVFKYVNASGLLYKLGMAAYTEAMNKAIDSGSTASDGLSLIRNEVEKLISVYDEALIGDIKNELSAISTDQNIPDSTRQRVVDFWTNYLELKSYVENPRGSYSSYRAKYSELSDAHDRFAESVKLLLGVRDQ